MSLRDRERFIRTPLTPKPAPKLRVVPESVVAEEVEEETYVAPRPIAQSKGAKQWLTRDDCKTCNAQRDELGRLPIGLCGPDCLMARPR